MVRVGNGSEGEGAEHVVWILNPGGRGGGWGCIACRDYVCLSRFVFECFSFSGGEFVMVVVCV